jgi:hypothetical protein
MTANIVGINRRTTTQGSVRGSAVGSRSTAVSSSANSNWWTEEEARLYESWAGASDRYNNNKFNPYFDYFFCGQDMAVKIDGLDDNDTLPIYSIGYVIQQEKTPLYGYASYCVDGQTEALTKRGWVFGEDLTEDDIILSVDPLDGVSKWSKVKSIYRDKNYDGMMHYLTNKNINALVTPGHKFLTSAKGLVPVEKICKQDKIIFIGESIQTSDTIYSDAFVELVGWFVTEGHIGKYRTIISQSNKVTPYKVDNIRTCLEETGAIFKEFNFGIRSNKGITDFYMRSKCPIRHKLLEVAPNRVLTYEFINSLSTDQIHLLIETMIDGDGWRPGLNGRQYVQKDLAHLDVFVALCAMGGIATTVKLNSLDGCYTVTLKVRKRMEGYSINFNGGYRDLRNKKITSEDSLKGHEPVMPYKGLVWCPETEYGTFVCRRNGLVYVTGNTYDAMLRGTRIVSGMFSLVVTEPFLLTTKIAESAARRAKTNQRLPAGTFALRHLDGDISNVDRYWSKTRDSVLGGGDQHLFSIHPPFNFLIKYGIQDIGMYSQLPNQDRVNEVRYDFANNGPMWTDTNERLYDTKKGAGIPNGGKILLENIELTSKSIEYDPSGDPILETYSFLARDERIVDEPYTMNKSVPLPANTGNNADREGRTIRAGGPNSPRPV